MCSIIVNHSFFYAPAIRRMRKGIKLCPCPSVRPSVHACVRASFRSSILGTLWAQLLLQFYFVWFDSLRPINNLSVIKGRVFLGWTSTKLGLMFLLKDTTQWRRWGSNPRPFGLESSTLPLSHCVPYLQFYPNPFETLLLFLSRTEDVHDIWI